MSKQQRVVFISGGGSGIGLFLARHFAGQGAALAVFDLAIDDAVRRELTALAAPAAVGFYEMDIRSAETVEDAARAAATTLGAPTLAINSAGIQLAAPFLDISAEQFANVLNTNLLGSRHFAAAVLPLMGRGAKLALVASLAGLLPNYAYTAYNASKYGVIGLAGALRMECLPRGIDVAVICPPEVDTPMVERERETMHPVTRELKQAAGSLDLATAGREIIAGLEGGKYLVIPGARARMLDRLNRWFPGLLRRKADRLIVTITSGGHS